MDKVALDSLIEEINCNPEGLTEEQYRELENRSIYLQKNRKIINPDKIKNQYENIYNLRREEGETSS